MKTKKMYKQILSNAGYPTDVLVLDFESYYDTKYSLSKMSTIEYVTDERFEVLGLGVLADREHHVTSEFMYPDTLESFLQDVRFDKYTVVAKNCKFDMLILKEKYNINPPYIIDIEDLTRMFDARMKQRLKLVAPLFGLGEKGDTAQFKGLHLDDIDKEKLVKYCKQDLFLEHELFKKVLPIVKPSSMELALAQHTLSIYLDPLYQVDIPAAYDLIEKMEQEKKSAAADTGYTQKQLRSKKAIVDIINDVLPDGETCPLKPDKNDKMIPALAKTDDGLRQLLNHPKKEVRSLIEARQAVRSWPLHIKRVKKLIAQAECREGYLGVPLKYHGGHTGRWSGMEKINLQNLGGGQAHDLVKAVRSLLIAGGGYKLLIVDSSQIEARVLSWLACQDDLTEEFRQGKDIYSSFASRLFSSRVRKAKETDPGPVKKILTIRRKFGKQAILGAGYGMGTNTFFERCRDDDSLRPLLDSGEYDWDFIDKLIKTYRSTYPQIPKFWRKLESAFRWAIIHPQETLPVSVAKTYKLEFFMDKYGTVHIVLPSGRHLRYRHASMKKVRGRRKPQLKYLHKSKGLWGGHCAENVTQAVARDLLGYWILEQEKAGIHVIHHAHDETISMVAEQNADRLLDKTQDIMRRNPAWAQGLPLECEGQITDEYSK